MPSGSIGRGGSGSNDILSAVENQGGNGDSIQKRINDMSIVETRIYRIKENLEKKLREQIEKGEITSAEKIAEIRLENAAKVKKLEEDAAEELSRSENRDALLRRAAERKWEEQQAKNRRKRLQEERDIRVEMARENLEAAIDEEEIRRAKRELSDAEHAQKMGETLDKVVDTFAKASSTIVNAIDSSVDKYLGTYTQYMSDIEARIQGAYSGMTYESLEETIRKNTTGSPYIKYTDAIENLSRLVQTGTMVNLTQRTFFATISDKIAATFDALDPTLLRLIRLQGEDTTGSRLGMEAELTKLFNYYFSDSSYLVESFDNVAASLTDLSSKLDYATSVEMEYQIQKWLGALGASGASSSTLTRLAESINALGTGDINWLTSNSDMQNLLVMSSNLAGLDYSEMLVNGVSSSDVNLLLGAIIGYIQDVTSGVNNVVQSQYASLFGITISDIRAFQNISDEVISELYESGMTYQDTLKSLDNQLSQVGSRMHLSTMIDNVIDNILASTGVGVASNAISYSLYKAADMLESLTGGIEIPTIGFLGNFLGLNNSVEGLLKTGVVGISALGALLDAGSNWASGGGLDYKRWLSSWDISDAKGTYQGFTNVGELSTSPSSGPVVSNTDSTGIQQSVYDEQKQSAEEISGTDTSESDEMNQTIKFIKEYLEGGGDNATRPLKVAVVENSQYIKSNGVNSSNELNKYDMVTLLKLMLDRLVEMGALDNPLCVRDLSTPYGLHGIDDFTGGSSI